MQDRFSREISYLRISVTQACNLRCRYCMPTDYAGAADAGRLLTFDEIREIVRAAARLGFRKIRLTGGEPLMRKGIVDLVAMLRPTEGIEELSITTNGTLLDRFAEALKLAGLDRLNISLDTIDPERYREITRVGAIERVLSGIEAAGAAGFPIKINMVVSNETASSEIDAMKAFCEERGLTLQLIRQYSLTAPKMDGFRCDRPPKCADCDRLRLLADGKLKPCLHSNEELTVDFHDIEGSLRRAVLAKPPRGLQCDNRDMVEIGG